MQVEQMTSLDFNVRFTPDEFAELAEIGRINDLTVEKVLSQIILMNKSVTIEKLINKEQEN